MGVGRLRLHGSAERLEGILGDDARIVEPLAVGLDAGNGSLPRLVGGGLGDVSLGVALRRAAGEALENLDLLGRAVVVCNERGLVLGTYAGRGAHTGRSSRP